MAKIFWTAVVNRPSITKLKNSVSDEDEDDDEVYVNIVTWSVGCERVGEVAQGGQLLANQGQE